MGRKIVDQLFLMLFFVVPLLPRPTAVGPEKFVLPLVVSTVLLFWLCFYPKRIRASKGQIGSLFLILVFSSLSFLGRVSLHWSTEELNVLVSRFLLSATIFASAHWMLTTSVDKERSIRLLTYGFCFTSIITIFVGLTSIPILEPDSVKPSRYIPFCCKTTGVFRSFGEFAIMGSMAWAYLLFYRRSFRGIVWASLASLTLSALLISQSRNVYVSVAMVTGLALLYQNLKVPRLVRMALPVLIMLAPLGIDGALPLLKSMPIVSDVVGQDDVYEGNVRFRYEQFPLAWKLLTQDFEHMLLGVSREEWQSHAIVFGDEDVAPHNHFLSNVVFLGVGGWVYVLGLFLMPCISLGNSPNRNSLYGSLVPIVMMGTIAGLSFYEGFFSLIVALVIALTWVSAFQRN